MESTSSIIDDTTRFLAGESPGLDYSVISVVILTLGIVLVVEVLRHQLDVKASGNPFFKTVLELMYRELTTLGIVEFFIYLLHKYHNNFNFEMEVVFVDVHFMLFYTAVFNAIQSVLVRVVSARRTDRAWVQTEDIDIGHYVAIRKEFDRVDNELKRVEQELDHESEGVGRNDRNASSERPRLGVPLGERGQQQQQRQSQSFLASIRDYFRETINDISLRIRHPQLSHRKRELLVPLRFHELRAHFIDTNNLPPKFKVSHYLKRSLTSVLLDFVHISSSAWVMLMATGNLIYFLSGIILSKTRSKYAVPEFLVIVFFVMCVFFVVCVLGIYFKMKKIFSKILHMKLTVNDESGLRKTYADFSALLDGKSVDQLALFWGGSPQLIIVATQYMQFGYALGLAIIFTYWKDIHSYYAPLNTDWMLVGLLISYAIFLHLLAEIIPWYTLCTSMGQLVNKDRLHETLAKLKLGEEIRKNKIIEEEKEVEMEIERRKRLREEKANDAANGGIASMVERITEPLGNFAEKVKDELGVPQVLDKLTDTFGSSNKDKCKLAPDATATGLKITDIGHKSMDSVSNSICSEISKQRKERSSSTGVSIMRRFQGNSGGPLDSPKQSELSREHVRRKAVSDGVAISMMASMNKHEVASNTSSPRSSGRLSSAAAQQLSDVGDDFPKLPELFVNNTPDSDIGAINVPIQPATVKGMNQPQDTTMMHSEDFMRGGPIADTGRRQRRRLQKTQSDNVSAMRHATEVKPLPSQTSLLQPMNQPLEPLCEKKPRTVFEHEMNTPSTNSEPPIAYHPKTRKDRRERMRSRSEGVGLMAVKNSSAVHDSKPSLDDSFAPNSKADPLLDSKFFDEKSSSSTIERQERKQRRRRLKTQSEGVALMRSTLNTENSQPSKRYPLPTLDESKPEKNLETLSELVRMSAKDLPEIPEFKTNHNIVGRRPRLKAVSDGVSMMRFDKVLEKKSSSNAVANDSVEGYQAPEMITAVDTTEHIPEPENCSKNVSFSIIQSNLGDTEKLGLSNPMALSVDSAASVDGESDIDDVPDAFGDDVTVSGKKRWGNFSLKFNLAEFLKSSKYRLNSLIFGPMVCFFIVAMRVESFNIADGSLEDQDNTWHLELPVAFWMEVAWYCGMLIELSVVVFVFWFHSGDGDALLSIYAAFWGILINLSCLLLMLLAEKERCCPNGAECCDSFGTRTYGGIGKIEPFTSLIALSPARFIIGEFLMKLLNNAEVTRDHSHNHSDDQGHHGPDPVTRARDLWLEAIGMHSDIARKYGIFSGEFLECMLGILIPEDSAENSKGIENDQSTNTNEGEGISQISSSQNVDNPFEEPAEQPQNDHDILSYGTNPTMSPHFNAFGVDFDEFSYPGARLIRRMRRCERKMLPFLNEWMVVDAALTSHELILFEVPFVDTLCNEDIESPEENIFGPNGGKGLRLKDIAKGRKVLCKFELCDIDLVSIERRLALPTESDYSGFNDHRKNRPTEYYETAEMNKRWGHVDEDRLKVHFPFGTLYLRFVIDLKELEGKGANDPLHTNRGSSLWCRTIARTIGTGQLKQDLPHFGNECSEEIDDFIEICDRANEDSHNNEGKFKRIMGRRSFHSPP